MTGSPEVEAVIFGPDGLRAGLKPGSVIVDCSTSDPVSTARMVEDLKTAGIDFVDAPLSAHAERSLGRQARHDGRRERGNLRAGEAGARDLGRQDRPHRRPRRRPPHEAAQQLHLARLCRDLLRGAGAVAQGRHCAGAVRQRHPRRPHGLRLLPDVLALDARRRSRRAQVHHRQRLQGPALSRLDGQCRGRRRRRWRTR